MKKKLLTLLFSFCLICSCMFLFVGCGGKDNSIEYTITFPKITNNMSQQNYTTELFVENDEGKIVDRFIESPAKVGEHNKVSLIIALNNEYAEFFEIDKMKICVDNVEVEKTFTTENNIKMFKVVISEDLTKDHNISIDATNVKEKNVTKTFNIEFNEYEWYQSNNTVNNGRENLTINNDLIKKWSIQYKFVNVENDPEIGNVYKNITDNEKYTDISLENVTTENLKTSFSLQMPITTNNKAVLIRLRYDDPFVFSMTSASVKYDNNGSLTQLSDYEDDSNNESFDNGYIVYCVDNFVNNNTNIKIKCPDYRKKFKLNYELNGELIQLMKSSYNTETYGINLVDNLNERDEFDSTGEFIDNNQEYYVNDAFVFKPCYMYSGKRSFSDICDISNVTYYINEKQIDTTNEDGAVKINFSSELLSNIKNENKYANVKEKEFNLKIKNIKVKDDYRKAKINNTTNIVYEEYNYFLPTIEEGINIIPIYNFTIKQNKLEFYDENNNKLNNVRLDETKSYIKIFINDNSEPLKTFVVSTESGSGIIYTPGEYKYEIERYKFNQLNDDIQFPNKTDCDYIEIRYEEHFVFIEE